MRILIGGGPHTGKTTYAITEAERRGLPVYHCDDLIDLGWSEAARFALRHWLPKPEWIIEGVIVPRVLRLWLEEQSRPYGHPPADLLQILTAPYLPQSKGQLSLAKGAETVLSEIMPELEEITSMRIEYL